MPGGLIKINYNKVMIKGDRVIAISQFIYKQILEYLDLLQLGLIDLHLKAERKFF